MAFDSFYHSDIRNPKSTISSGSMHSAPYSVFFDLRRASHSAEHESRSRFCPMTTTNTKHEPATLCTANRKFQGRIGSYNSETYLGSAAVAATTAIGGGIADLRELLS